MVYIHFTPSPLDSCPGSVSRIYRMCYTNLNFSTINYLVNRLRGLRSKVSHKLGSCRTHPMELVER